MGQAMEKQMDQHAVQDVVRNYIVTELLHGDDRGLEPTSPLLEWGVIESLKLMSLVAFLEEKFSLAIPDEDMIAENFASLEAISALVLRVGGGA